MRRHDGWHGGAAVAAEVRQLRLAVEGRRDACGSPLEGREFGACVEDDVDDVDDVDEAGRGGRPSWARWQSSSSPRMVHQSLWYRFSSTPWPRCRQLIGRHARSTPQALLMFARHVSRVRGLASHPFTAEPVMRSVSSQSSVPSRSHASNSYRSGGKLFRHAKRK